MPSYREYCPIAVAVWISAAIVDMNEPSIMVAFRLDTEGTILFVAIHDPWN